MNRVTLTGAMAALLATAPASGHDIKIASASGLLANCTFQSDDQTEVEYHTGFCLGFIKAVMNMHPTHGETFCIPESWDNGDLIRFVREALYRLLT
jgi:Rap1a immunity proteins